MRKQVCAICVCVLAVCLWLLFQHRPAEHKEVAADGISPAATHPETTNKLTQPARQNNGISNQAQPSSLPLSSSVQTTTGAFFEQITPGWQTPIEFYGKVVDESNNPVAGASVQFNWTETPKGALDGPGKITTAQSDADGLFALNGARGPSLSVSVSKEEYYSFHSDPWAFSYAGSDRFLPDRLNPVIFHLRKKRSGDDLIAVKQNYRISRDGTPLKIDLTSGKMATGGNGDFIVQCWTEDPGKRAGQKYDWHCLVTIPDGGLILY